MYPLSRVRLVGSCLAVSFFDADHDVYVGRFSTMCEAHLFLRWEHEIGPEGLHGWIYGNTWSRNKTAHPNLQRGGTQIECSIMVARSCDLYQTSERP